MRRSVALGTAAVVLVAVALAVLGATRTTSTAFSTAVVADTPVVRVPARSTVCQNVAAVRARFDRVRVPLERIGDADPRIVVEVQDPADGRVLSRGAVTPGWVAYPRGFAEARLDRAVPANHSANVCLRNAGRRGFGVWGSPAQRYPGLEAIRGDGTAIGARLTLRFGMPSTSRLEQLPTILRRATLFRASWFAPWVGWVLVGLVLLVVPALLVAALRSVSGSPRPSPQSGRTGSASDSPEAS